MSMPWILINITKREYFEPDCIGFQTSHTDKGWFAHPAVALVHHLLITPREAYKHGAFKDFLDHDFSFIGRWHGSVIITGEDVAHYDVGLASRYDIETFNTTNGRPPGADTNYYAIATDLYLDIGDILYESLKNFVGLQNLLDRLGVPYFNYSTRDE